jgi:hypothetical protein
VTLKRGKWWIDAYILRHTLKLKLMGVFAGVGFQSIMTRRIFSNLFASSNSLLSTLLFLISPAAAFLLQI